MRKTIDDTKWKDGQRIGGYMYAYSWPSENKTERWAIYDGPSHTNPAMLGVVKWFARWYCYSFFPAPDSVFETDCLNDLSVFCKEQTRLYKERRKEAKAI